MNIITKENVFDCLTAMNNNDFNSLMERVSKERRERYKKLEKQAFENILGGLDFLITTPWKDTTLRDSLRLNELSLMEIEDEIRAIYNNFFLED